MDNTKIRIIKAACKAVRQYGLDGVRIQNISELAGLSPGALYRYFDSKETLLETCFTDIDNRVMELLAQMEIDSEKLRADPEGSVRKMWIPFFRFWTSRPDETVFYYNYRNTPGFRTVDRKYDASCFEAWEKIIAQFKEAFPGLRKFNHTVLCIHMLSATVMYAKCVAEKILPDNEQTEDEVFCLLMSGLAGCMRTE